MGSRSSRTRSPRPTRDERRAAFLDAAVTAIRRDGPSVSMEAIAREAGVTKPILYRFFGDRDGLLRALSERTAAEVDERIRAALASGAAGDDPREVLRSTIDAYVSLIDTEPDLYRFVTDQSGSGPTISGLSAAIARTVALVLGEELRARGRDSGAAETWAYGIVGMVHLAGDWWVRTRTLPRERLVTYLVDLLWNGFAPFAGAEVTDRR